MDEAPEPVYANVERQPPATSPAATAAPRPGPVWETHTDTGTGRPYYYNPDTGETTWESPFEAAEGATSPATSPSSVGSRESLETEWGQYWDEESRRVFFYNPLTGDTVWEDEDEDENENELTMQPGLSPGSPKAQRVRGRTWSGWAGLALRVSDPASFSPRPWALGGRGGATSEGAGPGQGWLGLARGASDPAFLLPTASHPRDGLPRVTDQLPRGGLFAFRLLQ